jgi:hypothetical protein
MLDINIIRINVTLICLHMRVQALGPRPPLYTMMTMKTFCVKYPVPKRYVHDSRAELHCHMSYKYSAKTLSKHFKDHQYSLPLHLIHLAFPLNLVHLSYSLTLPLILSLFSLISSLPVSSLLPFSSADSLSP